MKKTIKYAFAALAFFAFTACGTENNTATETETTDQVETDTEMDNMETDTTTVQDTTVNDGVADEIEEEQPPVQ